MRNTPQNHRKIHHSIGSLQLLFIFIYLLVAINLFAQEKSLIDNYWVEHYTKEDGFPDDIGTDMLQDKEGFIWFTSAYHLMRFDGNDFKTYSLRDSFENKLTQFMPGFIDDNNGKLWMIVFQTGIMSFDKKTEKFKLYKYRRGQKDGPSSQYITGITIDSKNNIWISTLGGLDKITQITNDSIQFSHYSTKNISQEILSLTDSLLKTEEKIIINKVKDNQILSQPFTVTEEKQSFLIKMLGEIIEDDKTDYGWIEDLKGNIIWEVDYKKLSHAGGASKNKRCLDWIQLPKGDYLLKYISDDSHAYESWNTSPPNKPQDWGIQLVKIENETRKILDNLNKAYSKSSFLKSKFLTDLVIDINGDLWVSHLHGLDKVNISTKAPSDSNYIENIIDSSYYYTLEIESTNSGDLLILKANDTITNLFFDYPTQLYRLNIKNNKRTLLTNVNDLKIGSVGKHLAIDHNDKIWLGHRNLFKLESNNNKFITKKLPIPELEQKVNNTSIWSCSFDNENNLWMSLRGDYLMKLNELSAGINYYSLPKDKGEPQKIHSVQELENGKFWIQSNHRFYIYDKVTNIYEAIDNPLKKSTDLSKLYYEGNIFSFKYKASKILVSNYKSSWEFDLNNKQYKTLQQADLLPYTYPQQINKYYFACKVDPITSVASFHIKDQEDFIDVTIDSVQIFNPSSPFTAYHFKKNDLWLAIRFQGLNHYKYKDGKLEFQNHYLKESMSDVYSLHLQNDSIIWAGVYSDALYKINTKKNQIEKIELFNGKAITVYKIIEDLKGYLWLFTEDGIAKFNPKSNKHFYPKELNLFLKEKNITSKNIFQATLNGTTVNLSKTGEIYGIGENGFFSFHPDSIKADSQTPIVKIVNLKIQNVEDKALTDQTYNLSYQQNDFAIDIAGLYYKNSKDLEYAYQLVGLNKEWISLGKERTIRFHNLPAGSYQLLAKAANPDGIWSAEQKILQFYIAPPWWKTWWAYVLYALALLSAIAWLINNYRQRLKGQAIALEKEQQVNLRLKAMDNLKDEFLANTSHELRTPLNGIIGIAESLKDGAAGSLSSEVNANLNLITTSGRRLANLINDILDFSKLKNQELALNKRPIDLRAAVGVVLNLIQPLVQTEKVQLINQVDPNLAFVDADENRLQQILHNLIGNAVKFTHQGQIVIAAKEEAETIEISIADTGIGIEKNKLDQIFQSFEQANSSTTRVYGGTGLGLSISKQLVELHGGTIKVTSTLGKGATFTFSLPKSTLEKPMSQATLSDSPILNRIHTDNGASKIKETNGAFTSNSGAHILIVDDEPINLQVLDNHLRLANYQITKAENGQQALDLINGHCPFDLVILDVMMPKLSGYEVCKKLRLKYPANQLPIILLTAKNRVNNLVEGFVSGANDYLTKPFSKNELLSRIKTHIELAGVNKAYGRFVPHDFLNLLGKENIIETRLGDQIKKNTTILFSDIRSYTSLSELMTPTQNFKFINAYLSRIGPLISKNNGFINQFLGDGLMALFSENAENALIAAIEMQKVLNKYNKKRLEKGRTLIDTGIGIHTGELMLGIIGDSNRNDTGVISDAVNTASRVEGLTKVFGAKILISQKAMALIVQPAAYNIRYLGKVQVKGREKAVGVYECFDGDSLPQKALKQQSIHQFQEGLQAYLNKQFAQAIRIFEEIIQENPSDKAAHFYLNAANDYLTNELADHWDGVLVMHHK